jgi:TonB family protein
MRVERALEKMHAALGRRGVTSTTAALGLALASQAAVLAPAGLATAVTGTALAGAGGAAIATAAAGTFMSMTKIQMGIAAVIAVAGTTGYVMQARNEAALRAELDGLQQGQRELAQLNQEHGTLKRILAEASDLKVDNAELTRLRQEAALLRSQEERSSIAPLASKPSAVNSAPIYDVSQLDQIPRSAFRIPPKYPTELRRAGITGEVLIDFVVDVNGDVQDAAVIRSTEPGLNESAIEAVKTWRFTPGQKAGTVVNSHMQVPIVFTLGNNPPAEKGQKAPAPAAPDWF